MTSVSQFTQLATQTVQTAASVAKRMNVSSNGTQPTPLGGPSLPNIANQAMSAVYSVGLGGQDVNVSALADIAGGLIDDETTSTVIKTAGTLAQGIIDSGIFSNSSKLSAGAEALKGLAGEPSGFLSTSAASSLAENYFSTDGNMLAGVMNSSFENAADLLGNANLDGFYSPPESAEGEDCDNIPTDWIFITTPGEIRWKKSGETNTFPTYGSNDPYVIYNSTSKRSLSLGNCLIEGFSDKREVECHVRQLEAMMKTVMNTQSGYVSPYVWDLRANDKSYGHFIIENVSIDEMMRNERGRADRAIASVQLLEVPDWQIADGRDLATSVDLASGKSIASADANKAGKGGTAAEAADSAGDPVKTSQKTSDLPPPPVNGPKGGTEQSNVLP